MIIENIKGNIAEEEFKGLKVDHLDVNWYEARKRIQKLKTRNGVEVGLRLDSETLSRGLLQGDVLEILDDAAIVVNIKEDECIAVELNDKLAVAKVCYEIGNRHAPLFFAEDYNEVIMPYNKPMLEMLKKLGANPQVKMMKMLNDRTISSTSVGSDHGHDYGDSLTGHSHDHGHDHDHGHSHDHSHEHDHSH